MDDAAHGEPAPASVTGVSISTFETASNSVDVAQEEVNRSELTVDGGNGGNLVDILVKISAH